MAILGLLIVGPVLAILLLRANGGVAFLALCLGTMLSTAIAPDIAETLAMAAPANLLTLTQWTRVTLLALPFIITILLTRKSVKGGKTAVNMVVALACGALFAVLAVPLLPAELQRGITSEQLWRQVSNLSTAVIIVGAVTSMAMLLRGHAGGSHEGSKKHHK